MVLCFGMGLRLMGAAIVWLLVQPQAGFGCQKIKATIGRMYVILCRRFMGLGLGFNGETQWFFRCCL